MKPPTAILKNLSWSANEGIFRQILSLVFFFWIARHVEPSDLGIFTIGLAIHQFAVLLVDEPVVEIVIQREDMSQSDWSTGFWFNFAISITVFAASVAAAPVLAAWFSVPEIALVLPTLTLATVIGSLGNIHKAVLYRGLRLKAIAGVALAAQVTAGIVAVAMAMAGYGYLAFAANIGIAAAVSTILFWWISGWRPSLSFSPRITKAFLRPMSQLATLRTVWLLRDQGMLLLIGVAAGAQLLGQVTLAYRVTRSVGQLFEDLTNRAVLSLVSRDQGNPAAFRTTVLQVLHLVALAALPAYAGLAFLGPDLIELMFGSQWTIAGGLLPYVVAFSAIVLANHFAGIVLRAKGWAARVVELSAPPLLIDGAIVWWLAATDLGTMFFAVTLRNLAAAPFFYIAARQAAGFSGRGVIAAIGLPMAGTLVMCSAIFATRTYIAEAPLLTYCAAIVAVAVMVYSLCIAAYYRMRVAE